MTGQGYLGWVKATLPRLQQGIRNWQLTQEGCSSVSGSHCPQGSPRSQAAVHMFKGKQGLGLLIVSVTSRSFLNLFS